MTSHLLRHVWRTLKCSRNVRDGTRGEAQIKRREGSPLLSCSQLACAGFPGSSRDSGSVSAGNCYRLRQPRGSTFSHLRSLRSLAAPAPSPSLTPDSQNKVRISIGTVTFASVPRRRILAFALSAALVLVPALPNACLFLLFPTPFPSPRTGIPCPTGVIPASAPRLVKSWLSTRIICRRAAHRRCNVNQISIYCPLITGR